MDEFISLGWAAYATFDILHVGGWAKPDRLFCVVPGHDLQSESFKVSYLAHEAKHFSDYKLFPKLEQIDLEYRAKLTEISLSDSTYEEVIKKFVSEAKNDKNNPHGYVSHLLVTHLK